MFTVSERTLRFKVQSLSNKFKMGQTTMKLNGATHIKVFADGHHVATEVIPKVAKPSYMVDMDLIEKLEEEITYD